MYYSTRFLISAWYNEFLKSKINRLQLVYIAWSSPVLVLGQILSNLLFLLVPNFYYDNANILSYNFGFNLIYAGTFICLANRFDFCKFTKYSAWGELGIALAYIVAGSKNAYNTWLLIIQIAIGLFALIMTFRSFVKAYPNCRLSRVRYFIKLIFATASCTGALDKYLHNFEITEKKKINADKY